MARQAQSDCHPSARKGYPEPPVRLPGMNGYRSFLRPILFRLDPEWCHDRAIRTLEMAGSLRPWRAMIEARYRFADSRLESEVCGIRFKNPIGLAAGFDKSGRAFEALAALGF